MTHNSRLRFILKGVGITAVMALVGSVVYVSGGTAFVWPHLMYVPLIWAAFELGPGGGVVAGLVAGLVLGPYMPLHAASGTHQATAAWVFRMGFFILSGGLCGLLFNRLKAFARKIRQADRTDTPTGLPNNLALHDALDRHFARENPSGPGPLLAFIDIANADEIIDTLGYRPAREMLPQTLARLTAPPMPGTSVFRISLQRFALLAMDMEFDPFITIIHDLIRRFESPVDAGPIPVSVDLRIGIVLPRMAAATDELIQKASAAAHQATTEGTAFAIYDRTRDESSIKTLSLLGTLNTALQNHELALYFQPQTQIATGRVVGAETLIRWEHPREGLIPPDRYIAQAEKTWLVHPLSKFALETALQQLKTWQEKGVSLRLAVNLTARNLQEPAFMDDIFGLIDTYGLDPSLLEVEITERTMMTRFDIVSQSLNRLREMGIAIAIDDFGTGYSNLGLLARLPVDYIKLDQQYIRELTTSPFSFSVVRRIIQAAKDLKLKTIAEGVESQEIHDTLAQLGCDLAQGYHISPPLPPEDFFSWIQAERASQ